MDTLILFLDKYFITLYKLTGNPLIDYFLGTFFLSLLAVIIGEFSISIAFRVNKRYIDSINKDLVEKNNLSMEAMRAGDGKAYKACNRLANDAFGKVFFCMIALSAASLWPVFFALAWMQYRFIGIELPLPVGVPIFGESIGYFFTFFLFYILSRIIFKNVKNKLPYFKNVQKTLAKYEVVKIEKFSWK